MTTNAPVRSGDVSLIRVQRRSLIVLVAAQILSGVGLAAGVTVGALLAQDVFSSTGLAGLPSAVGTAGSAVAAVAVGRLSQARGRRPGLAAGYLAGAAGSGGVVVAAVVGSPFLLLLALFGYGAGTATNLLARYAGADLAVPGGRARAVSTVLVATTLGGVAGPNLAAPAGDLARSLGIPALAGPFLLAAVAYALAAAVLAVWLRPDPLLLARALEPEGDSTGDGDEADERPPAAAKAAAGSGKGEVDERSRPVVQGAVALGEGDVDERSRPVVQGVVALGEGDVRERLGPVVGGRRSGVLVGAGIMAFTQLVMVAIMTMTPVHMRDHGHGTAAAGLVIAIHIGAMYLPSPLTGWLVDRYGRLVVAAASGPVLLAAGVVAATAPAGSATAFAVALVLLGLGWNFGLISGTAIITDAVPPAVRARTQGSADVVVSVAGATGGMASGLVVAVAGYPILAICGGILALAVVPATVAAARSR
ncbi:MFS transporter [Nonomuraea sp. NPDC049421]|uniref:MFS transporter n=1 Tax=Nonomuraea sp. NPDC049421 TaxID=3155275 RepID=UPI003427D53B